MDIKVIFVIALFITGNSGDGGYFDHECIHDKIAVSACMQEYELS